MANDAIVPEITSGPLPCKSFPIHHLLIALSFDVLRGFPQSLMANDAIVPEITSGPLSFKSFPMHNLLIALSFDAT
jgi:hypothetical protein